MTDYIAITGVRKRDFSINAKIVHSELMVLLSINSDPYIDRNNNNYVSTSGNVYISRTPQLANIRAIGSVKKRSFMIQTKVRHD